MHVSGNAYHDNDHIAFAEDLRVIRDEGFRIVPLTRVEELHAKGDETAERMVALTCDDGPDFDYRDLTHPTAGPQRSLANILADFGAENSQTDHELSLTAFVIVSPEARAILDRTCMIGAGWWNDDWWRPAIESGRMLIGNHSWDHNHHTLPGEGPFGAKRGSFRSIDTRERADFEVATAARHLWDAAPNRGAAWFAYPYGESNEYLEREYFPRFGETLGLSAAFGDSPEPVTKSSSRWRLPRYVLGRDWKDPQGLRRVLREAC